MKKCVKCNADIPDGALFCGVCGAKQEAPPQAAQPKTVNLICSKCSGVMTADENNTRLTCPYCGSTELILESDAVAAEKIRSQAHKEVEFKKIEQTDKALEQQEKEKKALEIKKRKLPVVALVFGIISLLFMIVSFLSRNIAGGFIILIQTALFGFSFISGKGLIGGVDFGNAFILAAVAGWIEYIPLFISMF